MARYMLAGLVSLTAWAATAALPPLTTEITPEHPLLLFQAPELRGQEMDAYAAALVQCWADLDPALRPFAVLRIAPFSEAGATTERARALLASLQEASVPVALEIVSGGPGSAASLDDVAKLVADFTVIKGLTVQGVGFDEYLPLDEAIRPDMAPKAAWLIGAIDVAARYGRFISIHLDGLNWTRVMANDWCKPLYDKMAACAGYVIPIAVYRNDHAIAGVSSALGLWLEGGAAQWGIEAHSKWYADAGFVEPGVFGPAEGQPIHPPSALYRAMILNGAMTGATVYSFAPWSDLWFGLDNRHWHEAIRPTLTTIIDNAYITPQRFVMEKTRVAYQLKEAATAEAFHLNLRDIDAVLDDGFLIRGAYGSPLPGQIPELILDTGRYYWIPFLSAHRAEGGPGFEYTVHPAAMTSPQQWREVLNRYYTPDGVGEACIVRAGRGIFILNTHENQYGTQSFAVENVPAPVRQVQARRENDTVVLEWPFREGDVSYRVHKRTFPSREFTLLAAGIGERSLVDTGSDPYETAAYAVTALTNETEAYTGTVNYGDYLVVSAVESRIAEEVIVSPLTPNAVSRPIVGEEDTRPATQAWWPGLSGLSEAETTAARAIVERLDAWQQAFHQRRLDGVMGLYSDNYEDPQGWRTQYVKRAYQWFFERYRAPRMHRQVRKWDFSAYESGGRVNVLMYVQCTGVALTDSSGRHADQIAYFPRTGNKEVWISFVNEDGAWRILRTNPALPNFRDILSWSAGPFDAYSPGPDY